MTSSPLVSQYVQPLCARLAHLAPLAEGGLDSFKAFVVRYRLGEDEELSAHFDNSEVALRARHGGRMLHASIEEFPISSPPPRHPYRHCTKVTLNVCIGRAFEGGELCFHGPRNVGTSGGAPPPPARFHDWAASGVGHGVLHRGAEMHSALPRHFLDTS